MQPTEKQTGLKFIIQNPIGRNTAAVSGAVPMYGQIVNRL